MVWKWLIDFIRTPPPPSRGKKYHWKFTEPTWLTSNCLLNRLVFRDMTAILFPFSLDGFGGFWWGGRVPFGQKGVKSMLIRSRIKTGQYRLRCGSKVSSKNAKLSISVSLHLRNKSVSLVKDNIMVYNDRRRLWLLPHVYFWKTELPY